MPSRFERRALHVMPHTNGWVLGPYEGKASSRVFRRKRDAVDAAVKLARGKRATLTIRRRDREVQDVWEF